MLGSFRNAIENLATVLARETLAATSADGKTKALEQLKAGVKHQKETFDKAIAAIELPL